MSGAAGARGGGMKVDEYGLATSTFETGQVDAAVIGAALIARGIPFSYSLWERKGRASFTLKDRPIEEIGQAHRIALTIVTTGHLDIDGIRMTLPYARWNP